MPLFVFIMVAITIAGVSVLFLVRNTVPTGWCVLYLGLPLAAALGAVALWPQQGFRSLRFALFLFAAAMVLKGLMAVWIQTPPESDFALLYQAAEALARGENSLNTTPYFQRWPYQSAFVAVLAFCIRRFGAGPAFFAWCNVTLSALTNVLAYRLARRFASERGAQVAAMAFLLYPGTFFLVPVLSNQHLSEFLLLAALVVYTGPVPSPTRRLWSAVVAGLLLALSNAVRPMAAVVVLAALALAVLQTVNWQADRQGSLLWNVLLPCLGFVGAYFLCFRGLDAWTRLSGLNRLGLGNEVPEWKFVLGLNEASGGRYSAADAATVFGSGAADHQAARALIKERLSIPLPRLMNLMAHKIYLMWGGFEDTSWALTDRAIQLLNDRGIGEMVEQGAEWLCRLASGCYLAITLSVAWGALPRLRAPKKSAANGAYTVVLLTALAYFAAHLLIEIQVRYRSTMTLLLILLTAPGVDALSQRWARQKASERKM